MSEGISADMEEQSLDNRSNSQHSFEDEGIGDLSSLVCGKNDQISIKVCDLFSRIKYKKKTNSIVYHQTSTRYTEI